MSIYFDMFLENISLFLYFSDNGDMKGMTIDEIAEVLNITSKTAHKRLERAGIKPVSYKALYDPSVVETIRVVDKGGRPPKKDKASDREVSK
jgi:hypothetical protein